jgi:16S rRNA processing protein RimM
MRLIRLGKIVACHGLRGLVRVVAFNQPPSAWLTEAPELYFESPGRPPERHAIEVVRPGRGGLLIKVAGLDTRTTAESVVGMIVSLPEEQLPAPDAHEFYYYEVVGFRVLTTGGEEIGTIRETFHTGSNDVWVVRNGPREHLIPVIADVVRAIDRAAGTVTIEPLTGLLDL